MSSFKRVLSIGKEKKQPQPEHDPEVLKRSISRPHNLAPKPVIDEWAKATKQARIDAEERERDVTGGQPAAQPTPARSETPTRAPAMNYKPLLNVIFVDPTKSLPPTPIPSPIDGKNGLEAGLSNFITVAVARKSAASSWCCAGPDPEDAADQDVVQGLGEEEENKLIAQALPGGTIWYFRNEEEKSQAIRVLATLRESMYRYSGEVTVPKCGRECEQCLLKILARRNASVNEETVVSDEDTMAHEEDIGCSSELEETVSQVVVFVTEASNDEKAPRLSLVDVDSSFADELDAQLKVWEASKEF